MCAVCVRSLVVGQSLPLLGGPARQVSGMLRKFPWIEDVPSVIDICTVAFADDIRVVHSVEINVLSTPAREAARFLSFAVSDTSSFGS